MTDTRFDRLKHIVLDALDVPSDELLAYLDRVCGGDAELRERAEAMLAHLIDRPPAFRTEAGVHELIEHTFGSDHQLTSSVPAAEVPATIGRYPILEKLGEGGMGVVYLARDPNLEREIAIKTLPASFAADVDGVARFRREAKMLATVNHPGVTTIYSIEEADQGLFLTMEYVPGQTLAEKTADGPLGVVETLQLCRQIATALEASHAKGVIHRDLKPLNIKVTPDGAVKVLDFGLARSVATRVDITDAGKALGTPGYMSPEQLRGQPCDHRSDVWAFGCVLYACLTARSPFRGTTPAEMVAATLEREPDLDALPDGCPRRLYQLVEGCLTKSAAGRVSEMSLVRRSLDELIAGTHTATDPPRSTVLKTPNNLRRRLTSIIGREQELAEVTAALRDHRLVTLTGVGGCGKTRLAMEVAREQLSSYPDGVWLVELASVRDPDLVPTTVIGALEVPEEPGKSATDVAIAHARGRDLVLVLDNCEHLIQGVARFAHELLEVCPGVRILASSREELGVDGEKVFPVSPLATPGGVASADIGKSAAVRLFLERARAVQPSLELTEANATSIAEICRRLDGIPLALELAAARVKVMSVESLAGRLDRQFEMLTGGKRSALPRHQTLRGLIEWSYELLDANEQAVFRRLSIFAGGWTLPAAETVCQDSTIEPWEVLDLFTRLVEKSLVERHSEQASESGQTRFRMLETVREYAHERLDESGEMGEVRERHRNYFLTLAEGGPPDRRAAERILWMKRVAADHENLLRAIDGCSAPEDGMLALRFGAGLADYWIVRCHYDEGRGLLARALAHPGAGEPSVKRARVLNCAGILAERQGEYPAARGLSADSLTMSRELEDPRSIALALNNLAIVAADEGDFAAARDHYEEGIAIFRELGDRIDVGRLLNNLATVAKNQGDHTAARGYLEESLGISRELNQRSTIATALANLALVAKEQEDFATLSAYGEECLTIFQELGDRRGIAYALGFRGDAALEARDFEAARVAHEETLSIRQDLGDRHGVAHSLSSLGIVAEREGDFLAARTYYEQSLSALRDLGHPFSIVQLLWVIGGLDVHLDHPRRAARLLSAAEVLNTELGCKLPADMQARYDTALSKIRDVLGEEVFTEECERGRAMPLDEAIACALEEPS